MNIYLITTELVMCVVYAESRYWAIKYVKRAFGPSKPSVKFLGVTERKVRTGVVRYANI